MKKSAYENVASGGMDVHYKFSRATLRDAQQRVVRRERLDHRDERAMREQISRWPRGIPVVMEASFGWQWVSDVLKDCGIQVELSNCMKVDQMRKARGEVSNNKKDADLVSLLPGEKTDWWKVWLPPVEVRDHREWTRFRSSLVAVQTQVKNRIHAMFHRYGIFHDFSDLFGGQGREFLAELCQKGHPHLTPAAQSSLSGLMELLTHLRGQLGKLAWQLRKQLLQSPLIRRLKTIPGFGLILSHILAAEVGCLDRFPNASHLRSYCVLAPRANDTGFEDPTKPPQGRRLGERGNHTLKWAMIEAAHGAVRKGGRWRRMFDRYTKGGTQNRNRGYIMVAGELVKVVFAIWRSGQDYQEVPPPRPGSSKGQKMPQMNSESRSGTGQLSCVMAGASR